jgi:hypothetical protein
VPLNRLPTLGHALGSAGAIQNITGQLTTSRIDIVAPGFSHGGHHTSVQQDSGKLLHRLRRGFG